YIYSDDPLDLFVDKDARLGGSVILAGATFRGQPVVMQAGQKILERQNYTTKTGQPGENSNGELLPSINGPVNNNDQYINKTGFHYRKFLDEATGSSTRSEEHTSEL